MSAKSSLVVGLKVTVVIASLAMASPGLSKTVSVKWWTNHSQEDVSLLVRVAKLFESRNPDIRVNVSNVVDGSLYYDKLMASGAAGMLPDVFFVRGGAGDARFYARGFCLNLDSYMKRDAREVVPTDLLDSQLAELKFLGSWMALPYDYSTVGVYYNKKMFNESGLPFPREDWSWNDLIALGSKLTKTDGKGRRTVTAMNWLPLPYAPWIEGMLLSEGGALFDKNLTKSLLTSTESLRFFQMISDMAVKFGVSPRPSDPITRYESFSQQRAAMTVEGSWSTVATRQTVKFPFDVTSIPVGDVSKRVVSANGGAWTIGKTTKNKEASWRFLKFLTSPEAMRILIVTPLRSLPARKSLLPEWSANIAKEGLDPKNADVFWMGVTKKGRNSPTVPFNYQAPLWVLGDGIWSAKKGVEQLLATAAKALDVELTNAKKHKLM